MLKYYFFILFFVFLTSCKSKKSEINTANVNATNVAEKSSFVELLSTSHSNIKEPNFIVIESTEELNSIYNTINMTRRPGYQIPTIDFDTHTVIGLFMGLKNTGGLSIKIDSIATNNKETVIYYKETNPKGMTISIITHPCYIASVVKTDRPIRFELVK